MVLTVKSFDLQAIRKRYIESKKRKDGVTGSVKRREPGLGGVVKVKLSQGKVVEEKILLRTIEPRGIALSQDHFAFASDKEVRIFGPEGERNLSYPWLSYIHTIDFSPSSSELLVSSSGFDSIFTFNLESLELNYDWFSWEHGFAKSQLKSDEGKDIFLTRRQEVASELKESGKEVLFLSDPLTQDLPTAKRAAFINSAHYRDSKSILLSFFHLGQIYQLDLSSMEVHPLISGLKNPHGGRKYGDGVLATSTGDGRVVINDGKNLREFDFKELPGKPEALEGMEWIQNSISHGEVIISLDSNRTSFVIFDPEKKLIDIIPYNDDWAVQDVVVGKLQSKILQ